MNVAEFLNTTDMKHFDELMKLTSESKKFVIAAEKDGQQKDSSQTTETAEFNNSYGQKSMAAPSDGSGISADEEKSLLRREHINLHKREGKEGEIKLDLQKSLSELTVGICSDDRTKELIMSTLVSKKITKEQELMFSESAVNLFTFLMNDESVRQNLVQVVSTTTEFEKFKLISRKSATECVLRLQHEETNSLKLENMSKYLQLVEKYQTTMVESDMDLLRGLGASVFESNE